MLFAKHVKFLIIAAIAPGCFFAFCSALIVLTLSGCGEHHRFGSDPPIQYSTNHLVEPALQLGNYGGSMSGLFLGDPKTFNIVTADDADSSNIVGVLYDSLESRDNYTLKFEPRLAYLPKISKDGLVYTYTLRPGLRWSDGIPITADDVIFTLDVMFDPNISCPAREVLLIDVQQPDKTTKQIPFKYKKIDDRTVQFTLPVPWAPAEEVFSFSIIPKHALQQAYRAGQFNSAWNVNTPPSQLVASGPFTISSYVPSQRIVYKPNPYFWRYGVQHQHLPYLSSFRYLITPDTNTEALNFRAGGSDSLSVPLTQYPTLARYAQRDNYTMIDEGPSWGFSFLCFNQNPTSKCDKNLVSLFSQKTFRQAVSYAIDRQRICDDVFYGLANPDYGEETPADVLYYDPNVRQYPYNPALAKSMLLGMGCQMSPAGLLSWRGKPVQFTMITNTENDQRKQILTIIANDLRNLGMSVTAAPMNFNELIRRVDGAPYDWEACVLGFTGGPEPNDGATIWRSAGDYHQWWPKQKSPATPWEAQIDQDLNMGARTLDPAQRKKYYDDFQEILGDQQPMNFICYQHNYTVLRNHFGNIKPTPFYGLAGDIYWNLEEIYDTRAAQPTR